MGIFAVAKVSDAVVSKRQLRPGRAVGISGQIPGDCRIVQRDVLERLARELATLVHAERGLRPRIGVRGRQAVFGYTLGHPSIVARVDQDKHGREVLGGCPDHRWAADVYVFQRVLKRDVFGAHSLDKRVEVAHHYVDSPDAVRFELGLVRREVATGEDAAMDSRMERLDPAVEDSPASL